MVVPKGAAKAVTPQGVGAAHEDLGAAEIVSVRVVQDLNLFVYVMFKVGAEFENPATPMPDSKWVS